jgi:Kef-type K+ transport system membrane component KefB
MNQTGREPLWQDVGGILLGAFFILFGLMGRPSLPYAAGDVRATPEFNLIFAALFAVFGAFFTIGFAVRLIGGLRERR